MVFILYIGVSSFVSISTRNRVILGTAFQLLTGFIIGVDQVVANLNLNGKEFWDLIAKKRMRTALLILIMLSLIASQFMVAEIAKTEGIIISPLMVWGGIAVVAFLFTPYMLGIRKLVELFEKGRGIEDPTTKESSILWGNAILFGITATVVGLSFLFTKPIPGLWYSIVWWLLLSYVFMPVMIFSLVFLLIVGIISLFTLMRVKIQRSLFWFVLLVVWSWGGLLLLEVALSS